MQISIRKKKIYSKKRGRKILRYLKFRKECDEMKKLIKYILTFCGLLLIFNVLLFTSSLFPSRLIEKNVKESSKILTKEDNIYKFFDWCDVVNNNYTDVLMINEAYSIDNTNPVYSYMAVRKNYEKGLTENSLPDTNGESISINSPYYYDPVGELEDFLDGNIVTSVNYARYWHGYLPILRPLLIFFNISQIRKILLFVFVILFVWLIKLLKEKLGIATSIIFAISLIIQGYFFVSYSLESAPVFMVMMISSIILLERIDKIKNLYLYIFIIACITNFVDYLTVPLITLGVPLLIYILYKQKNDNKLKCKDYIKIIVKASLIWIIGYGITWLSKWIIYDVIYNEGLIKSAISQVRYRSESYNEYKTATIQQIVGILLINNLEYIFFMFDFAIIVLLMMARKYQVKMKKVSDYFQENVPIFLISLIPFVWYFALGNHTIMHLRFIYRHMLIFLIGILICLKNIWIIQKKKKSVINY